MLLNSLPQQALGSEDFDVLSILEYMVDNWVSNPLELIHNLLPNGKLVPMTEQHTNNGFLNGCMKYLCEPVDGWPAFMEELLGAGADVHGYRRADGNWATPFWHLLNSNASLLSYSTSAAKTIRNIEDTLDSWLGILEKCGFNVSDYLAEEERLREVYDQPLPDTLARVDIKASAGEVIIEREWAYLWREIDDENKWDWRLYIPKKCPNKFRLETFWRCVEDELDVVVPFSGHLQMPGSWEE